MATINGTVTASTTLTGTGGADTIIGDGDAEVLSGLGGSDTLEGGGGDDSLSGGAGDDVLYGSARSGALFGTDTLTGGGGRDIFVAQAASAFDDANSIVTDFDFAQDKLDLRDLGISDLATFQKLLRFDPSTGNYVLEVAVGSHHTRIVFEGLPAGDFAGSNLVFSTGAGNDTRSLTGYGDLIGGAGADTLTGSLDAYENRMFGEAGDDSLDGGGGGDLLVGGAGEDRLSGGTADDTLEGGAGADRLDGEDGNDVLTGGADADVFVYRAGDSAGSYSDLVTDFDLLQDQLDVSSLGISELATLRRMVMGSSRDTVRFADDSGMYVDIVLAGVDLLDLELSNVVLSTVSTDDNLFLSFSGDMFGGLGNDALTASSALHGNRLFGEQGNDTLDAGGGNDVLVGGSGHDRLFGGEGDDTLEGGDGADVLDAGAGQDVMVGGAGADRFVVSTPVPGSFVTDVIADFSLAEDRLDVSGLGIGDRATVQRLVGTNGNTLQVMSEGIPARLVLHGILLSELTGANLVLDASTPDDNLALSLGGDLFGGRGSDQLAGSEGIYDNRFFGEQGDDTLSGGGGDDLLVGGTENDSVFGGEGSDTVEGGAGNDLLHGGTGDNQILGGTGSDTASYANAAAGAVVDLAVTGYQRTVDDVDDSFDLLAGIENLAGSDFADHLSGNDGGNTLLGADGGDVLAGREGNDVLVGGSGSDRLSGGDGLDTASFEDRTTRVTATLLDAVNGTAASLDGDTDILLNIENLAGGSGNDILRGNTLANSLTGGAGNDALAGASGRDKLTGQAGIDKFIFDSAPGGSNVDTLTDMLSGTDKIVLDDDVFAALGVTGTAAGVPLAAGSFRPGTAAADASDRIIYDRASGALFYDADGTGAVAMVQFAQLVGGTQLVAADFLVIG